MTVLGLVKYYSKLLILQYRSKPKANAQVKLFVEQSVMNLLPLKVLNGFGTYTAIGNQLDIIAKYVGVSRVNNGFTGPISLGDSDLLALIKMAILSNTSGSSLYEIQKLINIYFTGQVLVFDTKAMGLSYYMDSSAGTVDFAQVVVNEELLPRPMGVGISSVIYFDRIRSLFGMCSYELPVAMNVSPLNDYSDYKLDRPWLNYDYALSK